MLGKAEWLKGRTLEEYFKQSGGILRRAVALPIFYKMDEARIANIAQELKAALAQA
jgi:hypothetical protein